MKIRKAWKNYRDKAGNRFYDVAFGPAFYVFAAFPWILLAVVIVLVIFAIDKLVKISKEKKAHSPEMAMATMKPVDEEEE